MELHLQRKYKMWCTTIFFFFFFFFWGGALLFLFYVDGLYILCNDCIPLLFADAIAGIGIDHPVIVLSPFEAELAHISQVIGEVNKTKFLGKIIEKNIYWKDDVKYIVG